MAGRYKTHPIIRRISRTLPWGYRVSEDDTDLLEPVPELMRLLDIAERAWFAGTSSQVDIARWLSAKSGVPISRVGLKKRLEKTAKSIKKRALRPAERAAATPA